MNSLLARLANLLNKASSGPLDAGTSTHSPETPLVTPGPTPSDRAAPDAPEALDPGSQLAREADAAAWGRDFTAALYHELRGAPGNLIVSPASIQIALAMVYAGARGTTAAQMKRALCLGGAPGVIDGAFAPLIEHWACVAEPYELSFQNRLFVDPTFSIEQTYSALVRQHYSADIEPVLFSSRDTAARTVNSWVNRATRGRIVDILSPSLLDAWMRVVIASAVFFRGTWVEPFQEELTSLAPFHVGPGRSLDVPTMQQTIGANYFDARGAGVALQVLELPYQGKHFSMLFVLPDASTPLERIEQLLTGSTLHSWMAQLRERRISVRIPRFSVAPPEPIHLKEPLLRLGMTEAFDDQAADFSGISTREPLKIDEVIHRARVEVDERGSEAAAATVVLVPRAAGLTPRPIEFHADRPFLFLIRDRRSDAILFIGRYTQPSA